MAWDEPWRHEARPDASEIPDEYGIWPSGRGRWIAVYFIGIFVLFYVALKLWGGQAQLIAGYPLLMWLAAALLLLDILGLYWFLWRPAVQRRESGTTAGSGEVTE